MENKNKNQLNIDDNWYCENCEVYHNDEFNRCLSCSVMDFLVRNKNRIFEILDKKD